MNELTKEIERCFGPERTPLEDELVTLDGFDDPDKAEAVKHFGGKSWETTPPRGGGYRGLRAIASLSLARSDGDCFAALAMTRIVTLSIPC